MSRYPYTVAHALKSPSPKPADVGVYRVNIRGTLTAALALARQVRRNGYLVWVEATGRMATR